MNSMPNARLNDPAPSANPRSLYFSEEHELLRAQVRRFVETEIKPNAQSRS